MDFTRDILPTSGAHGESALARSFWFLYTSMILILLTFVAGAFDRKKTENLEATKIHAASAPTKRKTTTEPPIFSSGIPLKDVFGAGAIALQSDSLEAVESVLLNHDVSINCEIRASHEAFDMALLRSYSLDSFFRNRGVPKSSIQIFAVEADGVKNSDPVCRFQKVGI